MEDELYIVKKTKAIRFEDNSTYQAHSLLPVKDVSTDDMRIMLDLFLKKAGNNMGSDFNDSTLESVLDFLIHDFNCLPVYVVASYIIKGSLGHYGTGRLVPKTIYGWMKEALTDFGRNEDHRKLQDQLKEKSITFDLHEYPVGQAICKKIDWLKSGVINEDDWDKISLKDLAERIKRGLHPVPELFGVTSKNK